VLFRSDRPHRQSLRGGDGAELVAELRELVGAGRLDEKTEILEKAELALKGRHLEFEGLDIVH
jgi:hypothetical protein